MLIVLLSLTLPCIAPVFGTGSSKITVREGEPAILSCSFNVQGENVRVVWRRGSGVLSMNQQILSTESRYRIESRYSGDFNLHIYDARPQDSGEYKCLSSVKGTQVFDVTLKVKPHRSREEIKKRPSKMSPACYNGWHAVPGPDAVCVKLYLDRERSRKSAAKKCSMEKATLISPSSDTGLEYLHGLVLSQAKETGLRKTEIWTSGRMNKRKSWQWENGKELSIGTWYHQSLSLKKPGRTIGLYCSVAKGRCGWVPRRRRSRLYIACQMNMTSVESRVRTKPTSATKATSPTTSPTTSQTTSPPTTTSTTHSTTNSVSWTTSITANSLSTRSISSASPMVEEIEMNGGRSTKSSRRAGRRRNKKRNKSERRRNRRKNKGDKGRKRKGRKNRMELSGNQF